MTLTPERPVSRWRRAAAERLSRGRIAHLEHEVRRLTTERDIAAADLVAARRHTDTLEGTAAGRAHTTLGAVLHRAVRAGDTVTISVPVAVFEHWTLTHRLLATDRAAELAAVPMPAVEAGPGDRTALPAEPSFVGSLP